jgi:hypothetical protein
MRRSVTVLISGRRISQVWKKNDSAKDVYKCVDLVTGPTHIFLESLDATERPYGWQRYMTKMPPQKQKQRLPRLDRKNNSRVIKKQ